MNFLDHVLSYKRNGNHMTVNSEKNFVFHLLDNLTIYSISRMSDKILDIQPFFTLAI